MKAFDEAMMALALREAERAASIGEVPVGAVVTLGKEIVVRAHNERESSFDPTSHAELLAMARAGRTLERWRLSECTLYVTLEPCVMCAGAIVNARVGRVVYGAADPKAGAVQSLYAVLADPRLNHRADVKGGVMAAECSEVLKAFFAARR
ncbi:MAG: tRNA adenosine(34) deaminase TadA [Deltaproteobacteria bacterium]